MGFLFAQKKKEIPALTGLQIQTAVNVLPIAISYGTPRVPMNIIYVNGFEAVKKKSPSAKGLLTGGKGGGDQGYEYFATFIGAICEGPITDIIVIFDNQSVYTPATAPPQKAFTIFVGNSSQTPWSIVSSQWPDDAFSYKNTAYLGGARWPLDSSATIPQLNFLITALFAGTSPLNLYTAPDATTWLFDADPAECIFDLLTNNRYGVGFPAAFIDQTTLDTSADGFDPDEGDAALSTYCQAVGFAWSAILNNAEPASSILDRWCKNLVVAPVWTGSILKFIPYYDAFASGNPGYESGHGIALKYYNPGLTAVFHLTDDDFIPAGEGEDPVVLIRGDVADVSSVVRVDFRDRYNLFNNNPAEAKDENAVELFGARSKEMINADEFTHLNYAATSAQLQLQRSVAIRNKYSFRLGLQYCVLDPMDILQLTDTVLGLDAFNVRIISIEEDEKGILTVLVEEFPVGAASQIAFAREENLPPTFLDTGTLAPSINDPAIFEPTTPALLFLGESLPIIMVGVSGGPGGVFDANWGGCFIHVSLDGITYEQVGSIVGPARQGLTTSLLAAYSGGNPDSATLGVDLSMSESDLESVTSSQAALGVTLCAIIEPSGEMELLAYTTATLTGSNTYNLTGLYRGLFGTIGCAHPSGSQFLRIDDNIHRISLAGEYIGVNLYLKFQSYNVWGQGLQDISDCTVYNYTPLGLGSMYLSNQLAIALNALQDVDLETFFSDPLDLGAAVIGDCIPNQLEVDLGVF